MQPVNPRCTRLSVALKVSPMAGGYGGSHDGQMASQHDRAKRFHVLVVDEYEEGDERLHRPTVIVGHDQKLELAAKLGVLPPVLQPPLWQSRYMYIGYTPCGPCPGGLSAGHTGRFY